MKEEDFDLLLESVKQAGEIKRGERLPGRAFEFSSMDVKAIRARLNQSQ
jgi:putative transcriptional regulator